jgi:hypothetical protein
MRIDADQTLIKQDKDNFLSLFVGENIWGVRKKGQDKKRRTK